MVLEVRNLSKSFGGLKVIDDLSFSLARGERLALIGPNGAGKTTVFNLITGVYAPLPSRYGAVIHIFGPIIVPASIRCFISRSS